MVAREYQGAGGLRLLLDEPLSDEMAKQVDKGHLVPVDGDAPEQEQEPPQTPAVSDPDAPAVKPNANSKVDDWRAYAVSLGMPEEGAADSTKKELQEWVQVYEDAHSDDGSQV